MSLAELGRFAEAAEHGAEAIRLPEATAPCAASRFRVPPQLGFKPPVELGHVGNAKNWVAAAPPGESRPGSAMSAEESARLIDAWQVVRLVSRSVVGHDRCPGPPACRQAPG